MRYSRKACQRTLNALTAVELSQMPDFLVPNLLPPIKNRKCGSKGATVFCYCAVGLYVFFLYIFHLNVREGNDDV